MSYTVKMVNEDLEKLRTRAQAVLGRLKQTERPLFFEFSGSPKSGKSTCIDIVGHFFRRLGYRILAPTEGASKRTPYYLKDDFVAFNAWSACYALTHVLEGLHHSDRYQIAILDRGLFDALVWFELLAKKEEISRDNCTHVQEFLLLDKWRAVIDAVFLFQSDPPTSMERENRDKLVIDPGRAMNQGFLTELNQAYEEVHKKYADRFHTFLVIDTGGAAATTPRSTAHQVALKMIETLEKRADGQA
jgi:thymidylate kinase